MLFFWMDRPLLFLGAALKDEQASWSSFSTAERLMEIMGCRNRWTDLVETLSLWSFSPPDFFVDVSHLKQSLFLFLVGK